MRYKIVVKRTGWYIWDNETNQIICICMAEHLAQLTREALEAFNQKVRQ